MSLTFPPPLCFSDDLQMTFFDLQSNFFFNIVDHNWSDACKKCQEQKYILFDLECNLAVGACLSETIRI